jgi:DNA-binding transcriptional LysR family regulator
VSGNFQCNNGEVIREAARAGLGIAPQSDLGCRRRDQGRSTEKLLENYPISSQISIWAPYPSRHNIPAKVTAFLSFLKENFSSQPYSDAIVLDGRLQEPAS